MNSKVASIISYIGLIGWLIAYFGGKDQRDDFSVYHLKQSFGLTLGYFILAIILQVVGNAVPVLGYLGIALSIGFLVFMIIGILNANNGEKKPLPLIGSMLENKFDFIK